MEGNVKKIFLVLIVVLFMGCVSYNPNYMESKTTGERIVDVVIITIFGGIIGASITIEAME